MQVIAHRGARAYAPENTLEAIEAARRTGADAVELDVQCARDGALVVVHDDDLMRTTDARTRFPDREPWRVCSFDADEIASLDAGRWWLDDLEGPAREREAYLRTLTDDERRLWIGAGLLERCRAGAVRVPSLDACLDACRDLDLDLHLELKAIPTLPTALAERALDAIERAGMQARTIVSSFDHQALARVRALDASIRIGVLTSDRLFDAPAYLARIGAQALHPGCIGDADVVGFNAIDGRLDVAAIASLRAAGHDVNVWTENDPARIEALFDAGVTGVFTDYPDRVPARCRDRAGRASIDAFASVHASARGSHR